MKIIVALLAAACISAGLGAASAGAAERFTLSSSSFKDGGMLDRKYGGVKAIPYCVGDNISPALSWKNPPAGTKSFALMLVSLEGREGLGVNYWVAYGIAANLHSFAEGEFSSPSSKFVGGTSSDKTTTYLGPCPPVGGGYHYNFVVVATDLEPSALPPGLTREQFLARLEGHAKASAGLVGLFVHP